VTPPAAASPAGEPAAGPLRTLAERVGILPGYSAVDGRWHETPDTTREAILAAMGFAVGDAAAAVRALEELDAARSARLLAPASVVTVREPGAPHADDGALVAWVPEARDASVSWSLRLELESGATREAAGAAAVGADGVLRVPVPAGTPHGYHRATLVVEPRGGAARTGEQALVVAPPACPSPHAVLEGGARWGSR
jgi:(1->4)-alpha-D-glucan 1-alpha-D-glucosylmutase